MRDLLVRATVTRCEHCASSIFLLLPRSPSPLRAIAVPLVTLSRGLRSGTPRLSRPGPRRVLRLLSRRLMRTRTSVVTMPATRANCIAGLLSRRLHDATEAVQFGDDVRRPGEPHCRVVVHPQDAIHHPNSQDQSKAFQAERSGLRDDRRACRDAPAECSGFQVRPQDAPAEHWEFRGDHQACRDAPAYRRAVQADRLGDPVSRVPVACPPGDPDAAVSKWGAEDAILAE